MLFRTALDIALDDDDVHFTSYLHITTHRQSDVGLVGSQSPRTPRSPQHQVDDATNELTAHGLPVSFGKQTVEQQRTQPAAALPSAADCAEHHPDSSKRHRRHRNKKKNVSDKCADSGASGPLPQGAAAVAAGAAVCISTTECASALVDGAVPSWHQALDAASGQYYYYNADLQVTQWEPPSSPWLPCVGVWEQSPHAAAAASTPAASPPSSPVSPPPCSVPPCKTTTAAFTANDPQVDREHGVSIGPILRHPSVWEPAAHGGQQGATPHDSSCSTAETGAGQDAGTATAAGAKLCAAGKAANVRQQGKHYQEQQQQQAMMALDLVRVASLAPIRTSSTAAAGPRLTGAVLKSCEPDAGAELGQCGSSAVPLAKECAGVLGCKRQGSWDGFAQLQTATSKVDSPTLLQATAAADTNQQEQQTQQQRWRDLVANSCSMHQHQQQQQHADTPSTRDKKHAAVGSPFTNVAGSESGRAHHTASVNEQCTHKPTEALQQPPQQQPQQQGQQQQGQRPAQVASARIESTGLMPGGVLPSQGTHVRWDTSSSRTTSAGSLTSRSSGGSSSFMDRASSSSSSSASSSTRPTEGARAAGSSGRATSSPGPPQAFTKQQRGRSPPPPTATSRYQPPAAAVATATCNSRPFASHSPPRQGGGHPDAHKQHQRQQQQQQLPSRQQRRAHTPPARWSPAQGAAAAAAEHNWQGAETSKNSGQRPRTPPARLSDLAAGGSWQQQKCAQSAPGVAPARSGVQQQHYQHQNHYAWQQNVLHSRQSRCLSDPGHSFMGSPRHHHSQQQQHQHRQHSQQQHQQHQRSPRGQQSDPHTQKQKGHHYSRQQRPMSLSSPRSDYCGTPTAELAAAITAAAAAGSSAAAACAAAGVEAAEAAAVKVDADTAVYVRKLLPRKMAKYWLQRYSLFSRFDQGAQMDVQGWYSVTPEVVAAHQADLCRCGVMVDAFAGCGGNAIQFARTCQQVIAVEISSERLAMAQHNARLYGVEHKIEFICADFFDVAPRLAADGVFLSPPWGGPLYQFSDTFDLHHKLDGLPVSMAELLKICHDIVLRGQQVHCHQQHTTAASKQHNLMDTWQQQQQQQHTHARRDTPHLHTVPQQHHGQQQQQQHQAGALTQPCITRTGCSTTPAVAPCGVLLDAAVAPPGPGSTSHLSSNSPAADLDAVTCGTFLQHLDSLSGSCSKTLSAVTAANKVIVNNPAQQQQRARVERQLAALGICSSDGSSVRCSPVPAGVAGGVMCFLPRNTDLQQLNELAKLCFEGDSSRGGSERCGELGEPAGPQLQHLCSFDSVDYVGPLRSSSDAAAADDSQVQASNGSGSLDTSQRHQQQPYHTEHIAVAEGDAQHQAAPGCVCGPAPSKWLVERNILNDHFKGVSVVSGWMQHSID